MRQRRLSRAACIIVSLFVLSVFSGCAIRAGNVTAKYTPAILETGISGEIVPYAGYFLVQEGDNFSVLTRDGDVVVTRENSTYLSCLNGIITLEEGEGLTRIHVTGAMIDEDRAPAEYIPFFDALQSVNCFENADGQYGYITSQGLWYIPPCFSEAGDFAEEYAYVRKEGTNYILNIDGSMTAIPYFSSEKFHDGMLRIKTSRSQEWRFDFVSGKGELITSSGKEYPYQNARDFSEGLAAVQIDGSWGYINKQGDFVVARSYLDAYPYSDGIATVVTTDGKVMQIDRDGAQVTPEFEIPDNYRLAGNGHSGCFPVKSDGAKYNLVDASGRVILRSDHAYIQWQDGVWILWTQEGAGQGFDLYLPLCGKLITDTEYISPEDIQQDTVLVSRSSGNFELINLNTGATLFRSNYMLPFKEGLSCARYTNGLWGFIDTNGEWAIAPSYDISLPNVRPFSGGKMYLEGQCVVNPLIYGTDYPSDELLRAAQLGLFDHEFDLETAQVSYDQFWMLIKNYYEVLDRLDAKKCNVVICRSSYEQFRDSFLAKPGCNICDGTAPIDRQHAAAIMAEVMRDCGFVVDHCYMPYEDSKLVDPHCTEGVAYCSIFDAFGLKELYFVPDATISGSDAVKATLRFFEGMLAV